LLKQERYIQCTQEIPTIDKRIVEKKEGPQIADQNKFPKIIPITIDYE